MSTEPDSAAPRGEGPHGPQQSTPERTASEQPGPDRFRPDRSRPEQPGPGSSEGDRQGPDASFPQGTVGTLGERIGRVIDGPLVGLAPWIVLGVFEGPGRTPWAVLAALVMSVGFLGFDLARGRSVKILPAVNVVYFAILLVVVNIVDEAGLDWLETWLGEISNITLTVIALASIAFRLPFTLQYAREEVPREFWNNPLFVRINYVLTAFWALAFLVSAAAGFYGDAVLQDNNDIWTGWIIQVGAILTAVEFTAWYPPYAQARAAVQAGDPDAGPVPPVSELFAPLTVYFIPIGIITLATGEGPVWLGIGFIVLGVALGGLLRRMRPAERDLSSPR